MWRLPQDNGASAVTTHQLQVERRESHRANQVYALTTHQLQVERRESHRANQVYALTTHQLQVERRESHRDNQVYALTTHQLQVERREPIKCMGIIRRPFDQDAGVTLLLFTRSAMGFLMTRELGLSSHPKDCAFYSIVSHWGVRTHTDHRWAPPAGLTNTSSNNNLVFSGVSHPGTDQLNPA